MENLNQTNWAFIVNPVAGNGNSLHVEKELLSQLEQRNIDAKIVRTEHYGHAKQLAKELAEEGFTHIIAVGGDGTFNEMASSLLDYPQCTIGIIPAGTGNDFSQIPGMPQQLNQNDWDTFFECHTHKIDVGRCNGNLFFNGMGLGFDAQVAAENYVESGEVKQGGKGKYVWHILKNLLFFKERKMIIATNETESESICFLNTISIGRRFAGDFFLTPKAFADDGLLDVCMVHKLNLPQRLSILLKVPKGEHLSHPKVKYYQTKKLIIEVDKKSAYHLDGELFFDTRFEIDIIPAKINIIYNPQGNHYLSNVKK